MICSKPKPSAFAILLLGAWLLAACTFPLDPQLITQQAEQAIDQDQHKPVTAVDFAPIPEVGRGVQVDPQKGYHVEELADSLYWVTDGTFMSMFLTTGTGVIVTDAPSSFGDKLLKAIAEVTDEPVTHFIYSHAHVDHTGGAGSLSGDVTYIGHAATAQLLTRAQDERRPIPTVTFESTYTLTVGAQTLVLAYKSPNHQPGNIHIYAPRQKVLMAVDIIWPGWVPFTQLGYAEDVPGFIQAHDDILAYEFDWLIAGHLSRPGTRQDVETQKAYIADLQANALAALQAVDFFAAANRVGYENTWLLTETYFDDLVQVCTESTEAQWVGKLAGADIFSDDNCLAMIQRWRID